MISVCLATYNGEAYIKEQIESILIQLSKEDELIISDDGSTDSTLKIIDAIDDERIKLIKNKKAHGINSNIENAIKNSSGDIIFLSDQDDIWLPGKIGICIDALKSYDLIIHDATVVDSNLNIITDSLFKYLNIKSGFINNILKNGFTGCCMAFHSNLKDIILPIPTKKNFYHDQWIGLIACKNYSVKFVPDRLILFRRHNSNHSSAVSKSKNNFLTKLSYRISLIYEILKRT